MSTVGSHPPPPPPRGCAPRCAIHTPLLAPAFPTPPRSLSQVNKSPPYYPSPTVFSPGASATPADAALWQSLGFNLIRLGVMMTGTMPLPSPAPVNATYLDAVVNVTRALAGSGVYTLVDFHQDLLSPAFCADGIPVWAAQRYSAGSPGFPIPLAATPYPVDNSTGTPTSERRWSEGRGGGGG
jgi:hypothetical protein